MESQMKFRRPRNNSSSISPEQPNWKTTERRNKMAPFGSSGVIHISWRLKIQNWFERMSFATFTYGQCRAQILA